MTFDALERSQEDGLPISLYLIIHGSSDQERFAYTDHTQEYTYQGIVYEPVPIGRSSIQASGSLDNQEFTVDITPDAAAVAYISNNTPTPADTHGNPAGSPGRPRRAVPGRVVGVCDRRAEQGDARADRGRVVRLCAPATGLPAPIPAGVRLDALRRRLPGTASLAGHADAGGGRDQCDPARRCVERLD